MDRSALKANYHKCAFSVWGRRLTPAVFGPQVYPGPFVCVLKDGLLSMTNGPPLLVCHWMGYTVICDIVPVEVGITLDQRQPIIQQISGRLSQQAKQDVVHSRHVLRLDGAMGLDPCATERNHPPR